MRACYFLDWYLDSSCWSPLVWILKHDPLWLFPLHKVFACVYFMFVYFHASKSILISECQSSISGLNFISTYLEHIWLCCLEVILKSITYFSCWCNGKDAASVLQITISLHRNSIAFLQCKGCAPNPSRCSKLHALGTL